jgi:hypothetical protein
MVKYVLFDGELVSAEWAVVLRDMRADRVAFSLNEGHRTIERQTFFYNCMRCCCCNNCNLAAFPSPFAPHIRTGRIDHAIDFSNPEGVLHWLEAVGLKPTRPAGAGTSRWENWHIEVDAAALRAYAAKHGKTIFDELPHHVARAVRRLISRRHTVRDLINSRDSIDSKADPHRWEEFDARVDKAIRKRSRSRRKLVRMLGRANKQRTRRILRQVLDNK